MKPTLLIIYSFLLCISLQAQVQKTLVKSIATSSTTASTQQAFFKLPGKAVVSRWDENFIRVTTHLKVENMNESIVKQLLRLVYLIKKQPLGLSFKTLRTVKLILKCSNIVVLSSRSTIVTAFTGTRRWCSHIYY